MDNNDKTDRRLSAIMFSDICDFSRLMGEDEERSMRILAKHNEILERDIIAFGGNVIKLTGDGLLAEFHSAVAAVESALSIQKDLIEYNKSVPGADQFAIRIGVHLGDVVVSGDDIIGDGVNVASRIESLALPGGICISQDIYNQIHNQVEMEIVSLGPHQLKNIKRQVEIYRVLVEAADQDLPITGTPLEHQDKKVPRKTFIIAGAALAIFAILFFSLKAWKARRDSGIVSNAISKAEKHIEREEGQSAIDILEDARNKVKPKTDGMDKLEVLLGDAMDIREKSRIKNRFMELMDLVSRKEFDGCLKYASPESRMKHGDPAIKLLITLAGAAANLAKITPGDIRIKTITLNDDRTSASLDAKVFSNGKWQPSKNKWYWQLVDNEWYVLFDTPKNTAAERLNSLRKRKPRTNQ